MKGPNDKVEGDFALIDLTKQYANGESRVKRFVMEISTGDLYNGNDEPMVISAKAIGVFVGSFFYALILMTSNAVKIGLDLTSIFWRGIPQLYFDFRVKGLIASIGNFFARAICTVPTEIGEDIIRIIRAPFYALAMQAASVYMLVAPLEGRVWISDIETRWRDGATYKDDLLYQNGLRASNASGYPFREFVSEVAKGKIYFLAWCMLKRGNINDVNERAEVYTWAKV